MLYAQGVTIFSGIGVGLLARVLSLLCKLFQQQASSAVLIEAGDKFYICVKLIPTSDSGMSRDGVSRDEVVFTPTTSDDATAFSGALT